MKKWEQLKADMDVAIAAMQEKEHEELYKIRNDEVGNDAGSYGQFWTSLDFTNGMIRDFSMYTMYPILKLAYKPEFDLEQLKSIYLVFHIPYTDYLGYSGLHELREFCRRFRDCFDEFQDKDEFIKIYRSFLLYTNKLAAWSFHYFPWEIGFTWKKKNEEEAAKAL